MTTVMPHFVKCSLESFEYRHGDIVVNKPVNLALCKSIRKGNFARYPDNTGKPSIRFDGCDVEWAYHSEEDRDKDFRKLGSGDQSMNKTYVYHYCITFQTNLNQIGYKDGIARLTNKISTFEHYQKLKESVDNGEGNADRMVITSLALLDVELGAYPLS